MSMALRGRSRPDSRISDLGAIRRVRHWLCGQLRKSRRVGDHMARILGRLSCWDAVARQTQNVRRASTPTFQLTDWRRRD